MGLTPEQLGELDDQYQPFRPFDAWASIVLPAEAWQRYRERLLALRAALTPLERSEETQRSLRAAALTTGAIEGLHRADRGLTVTVALEAAGWQAAIERVEGERAARLVEAALDGYDLALDLAANGQPVTEAWVRRVHEVVAAPQETYEVRTTLGIQEHQLPLGEYKRSSNHVELANGSRHAYAPVDRTGPEMHRLVAELSRPEFTTAHPVLQAAYAHHALAAVHPFADGNGRVARVLASVYLLRDASVPFFLFEDQKLEYFDALAAADRGDVASFAGFVFDRGVDMLGVAADWASVSARPLGSAFENVRLQQQQLRDAALRLYTLVKPSIEEALFQLDLPIPVVLGELALPPDVSRRDGWRYLDVNSITVTMGDLTKGPTRQEVFNVVRHPHADSEFPIGIAYQAGGQVLEVRLSDVEPVLKASLHVRATAWARAVLHEQAIHLLNAIKDRYAQP